MINLWSKEGVSVAQLMGEEPLDEMVNDVDGVLAEAAALEAKREAQQHEEAAGWDDVAALED